MRTQERMTVTMSKTEINFFIEIKSLLVGFSKKFYHKRKINTRRKEYGNLFQKTNSKYFLSYATRT